MVKLHVKKGDESLFLYETKVSCQVTQIVEELVRIYIGRLKIERLFHELDELGKHGITWPPHMQGLTEDQINELHLEDEWSRKCYPQGGSIQCKDPVGRRTGDAPNAKMKDIIDKTRTDAKQQVSKDLVKMDKCLTFEDVKDALLKMKGAVMIVYPMGLPPHDPIKMELENNEDLSGTQAAKDILDEKNTSIWWAGKEFQQGKLVQDYVGKNEKTKIVVKLQKKGQGAPQREPNMTSDEQKAMMSFYHKRQEEMKKLEDDEADAYLNSGWSDSSQLRRQFQGMANISWKPR